MRPDLPILTYHDKTVDQLDRDELVELVGILHGQLWDSVSNFEHLVAQAFPRVTAAGHA